MQISKSGIFLILIGLALLGVLAVFVFGITDPSLSLQDVLLNMLIVLIEGSLIAIALFLILIGILLNIL